MPKSLLSQRSFGDICECGVFVSECDPFLRLIILRSPGAGEDEAKGRRRKRRQAEGMCDPKDSSCRHV